MIFLVTGYFLYSLFKIGMLKFMYIRVPHVDQLIFHYTKYLEPRNYNLKRFLVVISNFFPFHSASSGN